MTNLPTPEDLRRVLGMQEVLAPEATYMRCADGSAHEWNFTRDSQGAGWYECRHCPTVLTKPTLKRATDRRTG